MDLINNINWNSVLTGTISFFLVLIIKQFLDFKLAHWWVKYFHWIPLRNYLRKKPIDISGSWEENWSIEGTKSFEDPTTRHSHPKIKQLGHYCYAEFIANGITYGVFGTIMNDYLIGEWYDINDRIGYFGTFHLKIERKGFMAGKWLGHSKSFHGIREGNWVWKKL